MPADTTSVSLALIPVSMPPAPSPGSRSRWERLTLVGILALAAALDFYRIDQNGYGNSYYAATVQSMSLSWHNWFFAAFDPGGFVTVDKPPLGFWLQVASVKLFGFHGTLYLILVPGPLDIGLAPSID